MDIIQDEIEKRAAALGEDLPERGIGAFLAKVDELMKVGDTASFMDAFLYARVAADRLISKQDLQHGVATDLLAVMESILRVLRVSISHRSAASLAADYQLLRSNWSWRKGAFLQSTMELETVGFSLTRQPLAHRLAILASLGQRYLRLGQHPAAIESLNEALSLATNRGVTVERLELLLLKSLRLTGNFEGFREKYGSMKLAGRSASCDLEMEWESVCARVSLGGDLRAMLRMTKPGGSHFMASYVCEAFFWARCHPSLRYLDKTQRLGSLVRHSDLDFSQEGSFLTIAKSLENSEDTKIPVDVRRRELQAKLERAPELASIDRELLVWLAASRWYSRHRSNGMSRLLRGEYSGLSAKLTEGRSADALNMLAKRGRVDSIKKARLGSVADSSHARSRLSDQLFSIPSYDTFSE